VGSRAARAWTNGQWLQMNITSSGLSAKSLRDTVLPAVSGSANSGAAVPSSSIVDGVTAIRVSPRGSFRPGLIERQPV